MTRHYEIAIKPWESSSEVFTAGGHSLGLSEELHFEDVLGLEGPLPEGTVALILVYITPDDYEDLAAVTASGDASGFATERQDDNVVFLSQRVQNACGPYALFHAVFNSIGRDHIGKLDARLDHRLVVLMDIQVEQSFLHQIQQSLRECSSRERRSAKLEDLSDLWRKCTEIGGMGHTPALEDNGEDVEPHFVCFAGMSGMLALFDGDAPSGPEGLEIPLEADGLMPGQALDAVAKYLEQYAHESRRDISSLLALVFREDSNGPQRG